MGNPHPGESGTVVLRQVGAAAQHHGNGIGTVFFAHDLVKLLGKHFTDGGSCSLQGENPGIRYLKVCASVNADADALPQQVFPEIKPAGIFCAGRMIDRGGKGQVRTGGDQGSNVRFRVTAPVDHAGNRFAV